MSISSVNSVQGKSQVQNSQKNPVKTCAKFGMILGAGKSAITVIQSRQMLKDKFELGAKQAGKGMAGVALASGIVLSAGIIIGFGAAIGAGIGAIYKAISNKVAKPAEKV